MSLELYLSFVLAVTALILIPGPNVALIIANSVAHGARFGLLTVAGTSSAMVLQLALTVFGMTALLSTLAEWFDYLRWAGVAYLIALGAHTWLAPALDLTKAAPEVRSVQVIYLRGLLVSLTNPKTLLFYGAFLPQFINRGTDVSDQLILLSGTFLSIAVILDSMWAFVGGRFRAALAVNGKLRNRLIGGLLAGAGIGLAFMHKS